MESNDTFIGVKLNIIMLCPFGCHRKVKTKCVISSLSYCLPHFVNKDLIAGTVFNTVAGYLPVWLGGFVSSVVQILLYLLLVIVHFHHNHMDWNGPIISLQHHKLRPLYIQAEKVDVRVVIFMHKVTESRAWDLKQ